MATLTKKGNQKASEGESVPGFKISMVKSKWVKPTPEQSPTRVGKKPAATLGASGIKESNKEIAKLTRVLDQVKDGVTLATPKASRDNTPAKTNR